MLSFLERYLLYISLLWIFLPKAFPSQAESDPLLHQNDSSTVVPKYFLTPEEIINSRNQQPRKIRPYTLTGNKVDLLVNGDQFFEALASELEATQYGDFIWMTGWDIDKNVLLRPDSDPDGAQKSSVANMLLAAIRRGVEVRILLNFNFLGPKKAIDFCHPLNQLANKTICAPDNRHNSEFGSLHQKLWVMSRNNETIAYLGSMDVAAGRYDTKQHNQDDLRQSQPAFPINYSGWTGGMLKLQGEVALDVAEHLYNQLTDPEVPFFGYRLAEINKPSFLIGNYNEAIKTQVLVTAGPKGAQNGYYSNWASGGELSLLNGTIKAINSAQHYIYISDQFLNYPPIIKAIAKRLKDLDAVILLTDSGYSYDYFLFQEPPIFSLFEDVMQPHINKKLRIKKGQTPLGGINIDVVGKAKCYFQRKAWAPLDSAAENLFAYTLIKEGMAAPPPALNASNIIYTHWKALIIDDEFAIIGSGGIEQSGMTNDIDMSIGLYDPVQVSRMRKQLWGDHLNIAEDDPRLEQPLKEIIQLWNSISDNNGRVRKYWPEKVKHKRIYDIIFHMLEPCGLLDEGECQKTGKGHPFFRSILRYCADCLCFCCKKP